MSQALTLDERILAGVVLMQFSAELRRLARANAKSALKVKSPGQELYWEGYSAGLLSAADFALDIIANE